MFGVRVPVMSLLAALTVATPLIAVPVAYPAAGINPSAKSALTPAQEAAVEVIVERYLLSHPDVLRQAIATSAASLPVGLREAEDGFMGNPNGDVALMAFIDRNSLSSRLMMPVLVSLAATDPELGVIIKELPLISQGSVDAALAAVALRRQGDAVYYAFEAAFMMDPGPADSRFIEQVLTEVGADPARLAADLKDPSLREYLKRTRHLAQTIGIVGTPAFLVGETALAGETDIETLRAAIAAARKNR